MKPGRGKSAADKARIAATNGHRSGAVVRRLQEGVADFDEARAGYRDSLDASDQNNRFMRRRVGLGGSGDRHIPEQALWFVRETSRHMVDNDDLIGNALTKIADNVVQENGARLIVETGDPVLDAEITARHKEWAEDRRKCDFYGQRNFAEQQWLLQFQADQDGDMFALAIDDGTIQLIEADRCTSQNKTSANEWLGVLRDPAGRVTGYRFTSAELTPNQARAAGDTRVIERYDAEGYEQVLHRHDIKRLTRSRGVPAMAPLMIKAGMLDDLQFATIVKAQSAAAHAVFFTQDENSKSNGPPRTGARSTETVTAPDGSQATQLTDALRYGTSVMLPKGVKAVHNTPTIPSQEHLQHVRELIRQAGGALGVPLELILLDASNTNYSGWRGVMDAARMGWRRRQKNGTAQFLTPVHRLNVRRWAYSMGRTARAKLADGSLFGHKWVPAAWPYVNPVDDANAGALLLSSGQTSPRQLLASRGMDFADVVRETVADRAGAIRSAIVECEAINDESGYTVSPLTLLGWSLPANSALITSADEAENLKNGAALPGAEQPAPEPEPEEATP